MIVTKDDVLLNEKVAKKLIKNSKCGKEFCARVISDVIGADYDEVVNNITLSTDEIAFTALTVNSTADAIYYDDKIYFNIEFNFHNGKSKPKQLESYTYQLFLGQLHTCEDYNKIKKIIQISIDGYDLLGYNDFIYDIVLMDKKHHVVVSDSMRFVHINLAYLRKIDYNVVIRESNKLMKDLYFLICQDIDKLDVIYKGDGLMGEIIKEAKQIAGIEKMHLYLTDEEMQENDRKYYFETGVAESQKKVIINMISKKYSLETISDCVNLPLDKVKQIIKESQEQEK